MNQLQKKTKIEARNVINGTVKTTEERFDSLSNNNVLKSAIVFNPQNWPKGEALNFYGDQEVQCIYDVYQQPLKARHVYLTQCEIQWTEIKRHTSRKKKIQMKLKLKVKRTLQANITSGLR